MIKELIQRCETHERNLNNGFPFRSEMDNDFQMLINYVIKKEEIENGYKKFNCDSE